MSATAQLKGEVLVTIVPDTSEETSLRRRRRAPLVATLALVSAVVTIIGPGATPPAQAGLLPSCPNQPQRIHEFDPVALEAAENLAFDPGTGDIYVSLLLTGEIRKFVPNPAAPAYRDETLAFLPIGPGGLLSGVALDPAGDLSVGVASPALGNTGLWKVARDGRFAPFKVTALPLGALPNGVTTDRFGDVYIADSHFGVIWRVRSGGGTAEVWSADPQLKPTGPGLPLPGPNGLKFRNDVLYVSVSEHFRIYAIPVVTGPTGSRQAGAVSVFVDGLAGDDFAFDILGNMYITTDPFNTIVRITPAGDRTEFANIFCGLDGPSAAAFGTVGADREFLYVTNLAVFSVVKRPSLLRFHIGIPGAPLPAPGTA